LSQSGTLSSHSVWLAITSPASITSLLIGASFCSRSGSCATSSVISSDEGSSRLTTFSFISSSSPATVCSKGVSGIITELSVTVFSVFVAGFLSQSGMEVSSWCSHRFSSGEILHSGVVVMAILSSSERGSTVGEIVFSSFCIAP